MKDKSPLSKVQRALSRLSYKPTFRFEAFQSSDGDQIEIRIVHVAPDSRDGFTPIPLTSFSIFNADAAHLDEAVFYLVRRQIHEMELHEIDEWLKIDGKHVKNPHPND